MGIICFLWSQTGRSAEEWISGMLTAYSRPRSFHQKATVSALMMSSRNPQGEVLQQMVYTYTIEAPAKLNLTVQDMLSGKTTLARSDGTYLSVQKPNQEAQKVLIAGSGLALLEQLIAHDIVPTYDMVFVFGGKAKQEEFRKQISQVRIATEDEKSVVLTARIRNEKNREDELQLVLDKTTATMRRFRVTTRAKIEGSEGAFALLMEFEPLKEEGEPKSLPPSP